MIFGIDLGRKRHFTVIVGIEENEQNVIEVRLIKSMQNVPFDEQISTITTLAHTYHAKKIVIDEGGLGMPIVEKLRQTFSSIVYPLQFTNELKQQMMVRLRVLFEQKKIKIPNHAMLINSLHKIQRKKTESGLEKFEAIEDQTGEHGDFAWALAMACHNAKQKASFKII